MILDRRTQDQYIKQMIALSDATCREDLEQQYAVLFAGEEPYLENVHEQKMDDSIRFLHAVAMFCLGNLDALDDVF
jgi:hypothetical protein